VAPCSMPGMSGSPGMSRRCGHIASLTCENAYAHPGLGADRARSGRTLRHRTGDLARLRRDRLAGNQGRPTAAPTVPLSSSWPRGCARTPTAPWGEHAAVEVLGRGTSLAVRLGCAQARELSLAVVENGAGTQPR
jgi:hypothetical protein